MGTASAGESCLTEGYDPFLGRRHPATGQCWGTKASLSGQLGAGCRASPALDAPVESAAELQAWVKLRHSLTSASAQPCLLSPLPWGVIARDSIIKLLNSNSISESASWRTQPVPVSTRNGWEGRCWGTVLEFSAGNLNSTTGLGGAPG